MIVFVPGKFVNPMNGQHGHWSKHARWAREWRERTSQRCLLAKLGAGTYMAARGRPTAAPILALFENPQASKTIKFIAHTVKSFDPTNLPACCKPILDGLREAKIIHSDAADSGHTVTYDQVIDPGNRGVEIHITLSEVPVSPS